MGNIPNTYDKLFKSAGDRVGLDWRLLKAQAWQESRFDSDARSNVGAAGLAQFMPRTWAEWGRDADGDGVCSPDDVADAIDAQARYMKNLYRSMRAKVDSPHDYIPATLAAYNWGQGNVGKHLSSHDAALVIAELPRETQDYIERVTGYYRQLTGETG